MILCWSVSATFTVIEKLTAENGEKGHSVGVKIKASFSGLFFRKGHFWLEAKNPQKTDETSDWLTSKTRQLL